MLMTSARFSWAYEILPGFFVEGIRPQKRNDYDKEKQQALQARERTLNSIISGAACNVLSIGQNRKKAA